MRVAEVLLTCAMMLASPAVARAQDVASGTPSGLADFELQVDVRASIADGETAWTQGGFGKLRYGGDADGKARARLDIASVDLAWKPEFNFHFSGLASVTHQRGQSNDVDFNEVFIKFRGNPGTTQVSARAGLFWPPISQEHSGSAWLVTDSITPSAINSWVGEEVKTIGAEATLKHAFGDHSVSVTAGLFGYNDTSGTLLSYRGWALHDIRATHFADLPLPPLSPMIAPYQDSETYPNWELDDKIGYYARIDWRPPLPFSLYAFRYDNRGDRVSARDLQTSWDTRFWNVGGALALGDSTTLKAQVMWGQTLVGPDTPMGYPVDVDFSAAYLLASRQFAGGLLSVRADVFRSDDDTFVSSDNNKEDGWAAMIAWKMPMGEHLDVLFELQHVDSDRPGRQLYGGVPAQQAQTLVQTALRFRL